MLDFVLEHYRQRLHYSALNTARSVLSTFITLTMGDSLGTDQFVKRVIRGMFMLKLLLPHYSTIWDVRTVLNLLRSWSPRSSLILKMLNFEVVRAFGFTKAPRSQMLKALKVGALKLNSSRASFAITCILKTDKQGKSEGEVIEVQAYPLDRRFCVVYLLEQQPSNM